jgi:hypothetical protein
MAALKNKDGTELYIDCCCGCNEGIRFKVDHDDLDYYCFMSYTNGNFYSEQGDTIWRVFRRKLEKIWAIIRNKDYYYSDVVMTKDEFDEFREYINAIE